MCTCVECMYADGWTEGGAHRPRVPTAPVFSPARLRFARMNRTGCAVCIAIVLAFAAPPDISWVDWTYHAGQTRCCTTNSAGLLFRVLGRIKKKKQEHGKQEGSVELDGQHPLKEITGNIIHFTCKVVNVYLTGAFRHTARWRRADSYREAHKHASDRDMMKTESTAATNTRV